MTTQIGGIITAPSNDSVPDGTASSLLQGKQGELLDARLHGDWYTQAYRGNLFWFTNAAAGTTIPIQASGLSSTFTLLNPASSGKNYELVRYTAAFEAATTVVSDVSLYYQLNIGGVAAARLSGVQVQGGIASNPSGGFGGGSGKISAAVVAPCTSASVAPSLTLAW